MRKMVSVRASSTKKDSLAELFDESVPREAMKMMASATKFSLPDGSFMCLRLDADSVEGGLTKKAAKKNEEIGKFISAVTSHRLHTYSTRSMLLEGYLLIIPTDKTVSMMGEYDFLTSMSFPVVLVDVAGEVNPTALTVTLADIRSIATGQLNATDIVNSVYTTAENISSDDFSQAIFGAPSDNSMVAPTADPTAVPATDPTSTPVTNPTVVPATDSVTADEDSLEVSPEIVTAEVVVDSAQDFDSEGESDGIVDVSIVDTPSQPQTNESYEDAVTELPMRRSRRRRKPVLVENEGTGFDENNTAQTELVEHAQDAQDLTSVVLDADVVEKTMQRRFFSQETMQAITSDAFDEAFRQPALHIAVPDESQGWLDDVVRYETKKANEALERFHSDNLERMRRQFLEMLDEQYEVILEKTSLDTGSAGIYGQKMADIVEIRDRALGTLSERVEVERARIRERYDEKLRLEIERATASAVSDFESRQGVVLDHELEAVPDNVRRDIDASYNSHLTALKEHRRSHIAHLMDRATARVLRTMGTEYQNVLDTEKRMRETLISDITKLADENRESEIHRVNVLEAELNRDSQLEQASRVHSARLESMRKEFEAQQSALRSEYDSVLARHSEELDDVARRYENELEQKNEEHSAVAQELEELQNRFAHIEEEKQAEFGQHLMALQSHNMALGARLEEVVKSQKKTSWIGAIATILATVIAGALGIFIGGQVLG